MSDPLAQWGAIFWICAIAYIIITQFLSAPKHERKQEARRQKLERKQRKMNPLPKRPGNPDLRLSAERFYNTLAANQGDFSTWDVWTDFDVYSRPQDYQD